MGVKEKVVLETTSAMPDDDIMKRRSSTSHISMSSMFERNRAGGRVEVTLSEGGSRIKPTGSETREMSHDVRKRKNSIMSQG